MVAPPARPGPARPYLSLPARLLSTRPCVAPVLATCGGGGGGGGFLIKLKYTLVAALTLLYLSGVNSDPGWLKNK